jgi:serine/threonine-protein kinase
MELLHGSTLRDELLRQSRITALRALAIMRDVCVAMDAAHRLHLVHRDLKPENIFLIRDGPTETAKILDFGVATALNDARDIVTEGGSLVGTLKYIAPAQLRGDDLHPSCDVWALGVIAYEMLTGSHPFGGLSVADISALAIDPSTAITVPPTNVPTRWLTLFRRVLALEPESRPDTPGQLFAELEQALRDVAA